MKSNKTANRLKRFSREFRKRFYKSFSYEKFERNNQLYNKFFLMDQQLIQITAEIDMSLREEIYHGRR